MSNNTAGALKENEQNEVVSNSSVEFIVELPPDQIDGKAAIQLDY